MKLHRRTLLAGVAASAIATSVDAAIRLHGGSGSGGGGGGGIATIVAAGGNGSVPTLNTSEYGSGWPYTVIAAWDTHQYVFIEPGTTTITVGAATGDPAGVASVTFYLNGNSTVVTTQTLNPDNNTYGFCIQPSTGPAGTDNDYTLYARVVPVNGFELLLTLPITLNSNGTITRPLRYVNFTTGNNSWDGTSPTFVSGTTGPWKTIAAACSFVGGAPGGAAEIVCAAGTYLEDANTTGNHNTRMVKVRPAAAAAVTISRTTRGTPTRDILFGCDILQLQGMTLDVGKCAGCFGQAGGIAVVYTGMTVTDPNGILGPTYGYAVAEAFDAFYVTALEESTVSCVIFPGALERNVTSYTSWDNWVVNGSGSTHPAGFVSRWNVNVNSPSQFMQRLSTSNTCTVTSSSFSGGVTTVTCSGGSIVGSGTQGQVNMVSGTCNAKTVTGSADNGSGRTRLTLSDTAGLTTGDILMIRNVVGPLDVALGGNYLNDSWTGITVIDGTHIDLPPDASNGGGGNFGTFVPGAYGSGGVAMRGMGISAWASAGQTVTLSGDVTSKITAGDTFWLSTPNHSDADQYFSSANPIPYYDNIYWQKCKIISSTLQPVLAQPGFTTTASGTVDGGDAGAAGVVTFSSAQTLGANAFIIPRTGAQQGIPQRIKNAISASTTAQLANVASSALGGVQFGISQAITNHAQIMCFFNTYGANPVSAQIQGGETHWVIDACTFLGKQYLFRNDSAPAPPATPGMYGNAIEAFVIRNSIFLACGGFNGLASSMPPAGYVFNNSQTLGSGVPGSGSGSVQASATFNTTLGNDYGRPTSGVTNTMTPPIPYDCSGRPITAGTNIGALAI